jgi:2-polyprenyl-3-methyl-5-hydroxy-6-metoxy-1,4-benzoquinol methylase
MKQKFPRHTFENRYLRAYKDGEFDHVLCIEVLEHLDNPVEVVSQIARVLKTHGNAIIATPDYSKWLWHLAEKFTPYKEEHVVQFTREKLEKLCAEYKLFPIRHRYIAGCDLLEEFVKTA